MKLFLMSLIATSLAKKEPVEIGWKEKQKVGHLKRNYAQMLDLFFIENDQASKPVGAVRFGTQLKEKMAKWHEMMVDTWHRCGRASLDPSFERMIDEEIRFNHFEPFKGMTQLTNQYKKWIERQIHTGCRTQREQQYFVSDTFKSYLTKLAFLVETRPFIRKAAKVEVLQICRRFKH